MTPEHSGKHIKGSWVTFWDTQVSSCEMAKAPLVLLVPAAQRAGFTPRAGEHRKDYT